MDLKDFSFSNKDLSSSGFGECDLRGVSFNNSNLIGAGFNHSGDGLTGVNFSYANMIGVSFGLMGSKLNNSNFSYANLSSNTEIQKCDLTNVNFSHADLSATNIFGNDKISGINLTSANVSDNIIYDNVSLGSYTGANFSGCQFRSRIGHTFSLTLSNCIVGGANFIGDFSSLKLQNVIATNPIFISSGNVTGISTSGTLPSISFLDVKIIGIQLETETSLHISNLRDGSSADLSNTKIKNSSFGLGKYNNFTFTGADMRGSDATNQADFENTTWISGVSCRNITNQEGGIVKVYKSLGSCRINLENLPTTHTDPLCQDMWSSQNYLFKSTDSGFESKVITESLTQIPYPFCISGTKTTIIPYTY